MYCKDCGKIKKSMPKDVGNWKFTGSGAFLSWENKKTGGHIRVKSTKTKKDILYQQSITTTYSSERQIFSAKEWEEIEKFLQKWLKDNQDK